MSVVKCMIDKNVTLYNTVMESFPKIPANKVERTDKMPVPELAKTIEVLLQEDVTYDEIDETSYIETDSLQLSYTNNGDVLEIRNIEVTHPGSGTGTMVLQALTHYAESKGLDIIASNVKDDAQGFWEQNGFHEGSEHGEFFKI